MLLGYGARNCWAFKEWLEINFRLNKRVPTEYGFSDKRAVQALCFEGPNASGKSCGLRVLSFIMDFCLNSFSYKVDGGIFFDSFFHNDDPSEFYITFCLNEDISKEYTYELKADRYKVYSEVLYSYIEGKKKILVKRKNNTITENNVVSNLPQVILKNNSSFISTWIQYGIKEVDFLRKFFIDFSSNVSYGGTLEDDLVDSVARFYYENPDYLHKVIDILKRFDTGIQNVDIQKKTDPQGNDVYLSFFMQDTIEINNRLPYYSQSTGTKFLYNRLKDFFFILEKGGILVFDEIDSHLHSFICQSLIEIFFNEDINKNHAQMLFTSHDTSLLDKMDIYRTYLFKKESGESFCYRLDEVPRGIINEKKKSLESIYKSGYLGGLPNV